MSPAVATALTLGQTVIFWGTFLWVLPMGIVELQLRLGWQVFQHPLQSPLSGGLFLVASSLGLWSGITMAIRGDGTPLPTATAPLQFRFGEDYHRYQKHVRLWIPTVPFS